MLIAGTARAQEEFGQTRFWGSGLIDIPTAWVEQVTGDFSLNYSGSSYQTSSQIPRYNSSLNSKLSLNTSLFSRLQLGVSLLSTNPEQSFYGQLVALREQDTKGSALAFLPSLAIGVRNVGPYSRIDRFGLGYSNEINPKGGTAPVIRADSTHQSFSTGNTVYGVATKNVSLQEIKASWPDVNVSATIGYGNGLFKDHGTLPTKYYAADATGGLFYGIATSWRPTTNTLISIMGENNAWDFNAGASIDWRGIRAGIDVIDLGGGSQKLNAAIPATALYHYTKFAFTLGWHSNVFALLNGKFLEDRAAVLRKERDGLLADISKRQTRIAELQGLVKQYEAQNLLELEQRRAAAQTELQQETEALRRLEDRLKRIEAQQGSSPPPPPQTSNPQ
ncbi:MAG TPA: hypothetical protein VFA43_19110 [Gemmatimonadaceae bacterium]|nr:hypothetical protein [Gemmatimonadaceae bacterium]